MDKSKVDVLLGVDFCRKTKMQINFDPDSFNWLNSSLISPDEIYATYCKENTKIISKTFSPLPTQIFGKFKFGYFIPDQSLQEIGINIERCFVKISETIQIYAFNSNDNTVTIALDQKIGEILPIREKFPEQDPDEKDFVLHGLKRERRT